MNLKGTKKKNQVSNVNIFEQQETNQTMSRKKNVYNQAKRGVKR